MVTNDEVLVESSDETEVLIGAAVRLAAVRDVGEVDEHLLKLADACGERDKSSADEVEG